VGPHMLTLVMPSLSTSWQQHMQQQTQQVEVRSAGLHDMSLQMGEFKCPTC
jgi:hypothetical protein